MFKIYLLPSILPIRPPHLASFQRPFGAIAAFVGLAEWAAVKVGVADWQAFFDPFSGSSTPFAVCLDWLGMRLFVVLYKLYSWAGQTYLSVDKDTWLLNKRACKSRNLVLGFSLSSRNPNITWLFFLTCHLGISGSDLINGEIAKRQEKLAEKRWKQLAGAVRVRKQTTLHNTAQHAWSLSHTAKQYDIRWYVHKKIGC